MGQYNTDVVESVNIEKLIIIADATIYSTETYSPPK